MYQPKKFKLTFRTWLNSFWQEHLDEVAVFTGQPCAYSFGDYFQRNREWLINKYKEQRCG